MSRFLIDTTVPSEVLRPRPDSNVVGWLIGQVKEYLFISVVTLGELRKGVTLLPYSSRRAQLEVSIQEHVPGSVNEFCP